MMEYEEYVARILPLQLRRGTRRGREDVTRVGGMSRGERRRVIRGYELTGSPCSTSLEAGSVT